MNGMQDRGRSTGQFSSIYATQAGFSLVELMVASTVGLVIMLAILTLYTNVTRTNDEMAKTNELVENGRFAIQLLQDDLAHAGFWDTHVPEFDDLTFADDPDVPAAVRSPCSNYATTWDLIGRIGLPVFVYASSADMPSGCSTLLAGYKSGTDILVVRHAQTCVAGVAGCEAAVSGKLYFQASRCEGEDAYRLATTGLDLHERDCTTLAPKRKYVSNIYYIRDYAVTVGDGIPTLMRSEFDLDGGAVKANTPVPLIEGIEGFRVQLGVDRISDAGIDVISDANSSNRYTSEVIWADEDRLVSPINRGDGVPDEFVHCSDICGVGRLANVVAVKLHLLVRNRIASQGHVDSKSYTLGDQPIAAANDGFKRHVFSMAVRLSNISGRRETP